MTNGTQLPVEPVQAQPVGPVQPHRGTMVLVFGIIAWVMGSNDLKEIDAGRMDPSGRGITQAGQICGIIATVLWLAGVVIWLLVAVIGGTAASFAPGR